MMGRQTGDQSQLIYLFNLERRIPAGHLLRRINPVVSRILLELRDKLAPFYSGIGRPSIDPELMIRMLIIGYCTASAPSGGCARRLSFTLRTAGFVASILTTRCRITRRSRSIGMAGFAIATFCARSLRLWGGLHPSRSDHWRGLSVDASVMEANASRYHGKAPEEIAWAEPERQTRAVKEYLAGLDVDAQPNPDRKPPKVISPSDPCSAWTAKANKRVQFGYGLNYLIDIENAVIVDVEPTPARTYDEVASTKTMLDRTERCFGLKPKRLAADTAYGTGRFLGSLVDQRIVPHIPVRDASERETHVFLCTFVWIGGAAFTSARTARCCTPPVPCTRHTLRYRASKFDCEVCPLKMQCCPNSPTRQFPAMFMNTPAT